MQHDGGPVQLQGSGQSSETAGGCVARDAGIHYGILVPFGAQPLAEQRDPGLLLGDAVAGTEAVTHHEQGRAQVRRAQPWRTDSEEHEQHRRRGSEPEYPRVEAHGCCAACRKLDKAG